jgi:hypothetical protein
MLVVYNEALRDILVRLYHMGMRKGDFLFFAIDWLNLELLNFEDKKIEYKIREMSGGYSLLRMYEI